MHENKSRKLEAIYFFVDSQEWECNAAPMSNLNPAPAVPPRFFRTLLKSDAFLAAIGRRTSLVALASGMLINTPVFGESSPSPEHTGMPVFFDEPLTEEQLLNLQPAEVVPFKTGEKLLDAWWEVWLNFGIAPEGGDIRNIPDWKQKWEEIAEQLPLVKDTYRNPVGDFAVVFEAEQANGGTRAFGLHPGPFLQPWKIGTDWGLEFWLRGERMESSPILVLVDAEGRRAVGSLEEFAPDGQWQRLKVALSTLRPETGFDWQSVRAVQFEQDWPETARLGIDGARFFKDDLEIGISDKSLDQRMNEARRTRLLRMHESVINSPMMTGAPTKGQPQGTVNLAPYALWPREGLDLEDANRQLAEAITTNIQEEKGDVGGDIVQPAGVALYWMFGSSSQILPGRLTPETEALLEKWIWKTNEKSNDIHLARMSSLWIWSSENHDSSWRSRALLSSALFKDLPDYKDRRYADRGYGAGHPKYGYPPSDEDELRSYFPHSGEFGPLADGKRSTPPEQYEAWKDLWVRYFQDRAKVNFWLEEAGRYRGALLRAVYAVRLFGRDPEVTQAAGMFLDLFWLTYSQNSLLGYQGGPKHRHDANEFDSQLDPFVTFELGGPATGESLWYWRMPVVELMPGDYELPRIAWRMMLDKKGMGDFEFFARGFGEENNILPRPEGTQNIFMMDGEQRMVRYRYNTPDYLFSSLYQSPEMSHSHLSVWRLQGLQVPAEGAFISPGSVIEEPKKVFSQQTTPMHGVQSKTVYVGFLDPLMRARGPEWFPSYTIAGHPTKSAVYMAGWRNLVERDGWIFGRAGEVFAAVRMVIPERDEAGLHKRDPENPDRVLLRTEDCYVWNEDRTFFESADSAKFVHSRGEPDFQHAMTFRHEAIILEVGRKQEFGTYEDFQDAILANKLEVWQARFAPILVYRGAGKGAKEIVLNLLHRDVPPMVGGKHVDYAPPWTWHSPFMESKYKSGVIRAEYGGDKLLLDFNTMLRENNE